MADREGFEPSVLLPAHTLSKRAHSTTLTPALGGREARKRSGAWQSIFQKFSGIGENAGKIWPLWLWQGRDDDGVFVAAPDGVRAGLEQGFAASEGCQSGVLLDGK